MKKILLLLSLLPIIISAQYNIETANEKGFEQSPLQFNSYFLNPYGIYYFKEVTPGLISDPFLNLYLNPANIPCIGDKDFHFYLDFRGDRTENEIVTDYVVPMYDYASSEMGVRSSWIDPRYLVQTRTEPEPIVSFGFITFPVSEITRKFFVAATYQIISRNENFYNTPYYLYSTNPAVDAFGEGIKGYENMPVRDAYNGIDEMMTTSHLFSFYTGYEFIEGLSVGLGMNAVIQKRSGEYGDTYDYPDYYNSFAQYVSSYSQSRDNKYYHLDWSIGVNYNITPKLTLGVKAGLLNGKAEQDYNNSNIYRSDYDYGDMLNYYNSTYYSNTDQLWERDGNTKYVGLNFKKVIDDNKSVKGYYRFTNSEIDLTNSSNVLDTTNYESYWSDNSYESYSHGRSYLYDSRRGTGEKSSNKHEVMINFDWVLSDVSHVMIGAYYYNTSETLNSSEPVIANRVSDYYYKDYYNSNVTHDYREEYEDKVLEWKSDANYWSFQIPIIMQFTLSDNWGLIFGLNRVLNSWEITDETTAYYTTKKTNNNGVIEEKHNFGERYKMPTDRISDDATRFFGGIELNITDELKTKIMFEPEFEDEFRIAQWWLSFGANL